MTCTHCGNNIPNGNANFCNRCGQPLEPAAPAASRKSTGGGRGFSPRISDPAFARYLKASGTWSLLFASLLAVAAVTGFFLYGHLSDEMDNPQALFIGMGIGGMFLAIALLQIAGRKRTRTWDGIVVDKRVEHKRKKVGDGSSGYRMEPYVLYTVLLKEDGGKRHEIRTEDDDTVYNYYQVGDRVRHHKGLNSYEKYDKSGDSIIFCNACASLNDIRDEYCFRCKCPLLK
ncbi:zinc ribbon domain-containing protein [Anaerotalea alkaliphila]|uniref:Zinc ribbon domain-containing protein n=1 Tax=Anaerotalea alkaliphila TaxID=2662126 RepID=A0A7X5HU39_9FIRM|nr:zinc ribbon domain-containing protein [Anaerotalea alkaliphila]NDL66446.1 zinc ribbon domain-containing protein [Anaerotalea alkaliphila]